MHELDSNKIKNKKFQRSNTYKVVNKKHESKKKIIIKSFSNKNISYSINEILDNYNSNNNNYLILTDNEQITKTQLLRIRSSEEIIRDIKSRLKLNKNLYFFTQDKNDIKINKQNTRALNYRRKLYLKKASHFGEFLNYNVFNEKDNEIKELIDNYNKQISKQKIKKKERKKQIWNKLYGITPEYNNIIKTAKRKKNLSLEDYQDNILIALNSNGMFSSENLSDLYQKLKNIKMDIETVTPYPKINIKNIVKHFKKRVKNDKIPRLKDFFLKNKEKPDKFERDEKTIISLKLKKYNNQISRIKPDNLYMLPLHIRKLFIKK